LLWCVLPLAAAPRTIVDFDSDWRFFKGEPAPGFDDSTWRTVRVPHDWSIEGPFDEKNPTGQGGDSCLRASAGIANTSPLPRIGASSSSSMA
jgi:hypothetical protein